MLNDALRDTRTVLTVGFFDGVHKGHRAVLDAVRQEADRLEARAVVVTFDRPPRAVLAGTNVPLLTTVEEKARLLQESGMSDVVVIPFDRSFAELTAEDFVRSILVEKIGLQTIVLGYDHRFGRGGTGNIETMRSLGRRHGFEVVVVSAKKNDGIAYSSTRIRDMLVAGRVDTAANHLGRFHMLRGEVVHGDGRGRRIGFPTANLDLLDEEKVRPPVGVYAVFVQIEEETGWRRGVMNVGYRPTVTDSDEIVSEVHLLDFDADLYGRQLHVALVKRLRDEIRFAGLDNLIEQIGADVANCIMELKHVSYPD
jgi:riboflavin kinase/FMN adenylyltransferase